MSAKATIFHNPRCSKSRQTLALLREHDINVEVVEYLKTPLTGDLLRSIIAKLDGKASTIIRRGEKLFKTLELADRIDDDEYLIQMMVEHPILVERPIVVTKRGVAIGRPPENILTLFP